MTEFNKPTPEDDAFNHIEMMSRVKQENVKAQMQAKTQQEFYDELRNGVIEEVAVAIEKMKVFGNDTISSFAIYIREMKK
jgi:hypothetical protein